MPSFLAPARTKDSGWIPPGRACGGMGYWAVLRLGSSCCCLRKLNETNGVDGSEGEVMETDAGADMATARTLLLALHPGAHPSPTQKERLGWRENLDAASPTCFSRSFPGGASGKESACQYRRHNRCEFNPWVRKIPWRRTQQPTPVFLPGKSHGQRRLGRLLSIRFQRGLNTKTKLR